eukprot:365467-Chlamydomonas_euryale.AAC.7
MHRKRDAEYAVPARACTCSSRASARPLVYCSFMLTCSCRDEGAVVMVQCHTIPVKRYFDFSYAV